MNLQLSINHERILHEEPLNESLINPSSHQRMIKGNLKYLNDNSLKNPHESAQ